MNAESVCDGQTIAGMTASPTTAGTITAGPAATP